MTFELAISVACTLSLTRSPLDLQHLQSVARDNGDKRQFCVLYTIAALTWAVDSDLLCMEQAGRNDQGAGRPTE